MSNLRDFTLLLKFQSPTKIMSDTKINQFQPAIISSDLYILSGWIYYCMKILELQPFFTCIYDTYHFLISEKVTFLWYTIVSHIRWVSVNLMNLRVYRIDSKSRAVTCTIYRTVRNFRGVQSFVDFVESFYPYLILASDQNRYASKI